jgi:hypothetical protein
MGSTTPAPDPPSDDVLEVQIGRAEKTLDRLLEWIRAVDTKTPVVMAVDTAMLGVLAALAPSPDQFGATTWLCIAFGSVALIVSLGLCAMATFPQTKGPEGSLIYFGGIAARSAEAFAQAMYEQTNTQYLDDLLRQCHRNAEIAANKYARVRRALFWLVGGIVPWLATLYLLSRGS